MDKTTQQNPHRELMIRATYERKAYQKTEDPDAVTYHDASLRVDGNGVLPYEGSAAQLQIEIVGDPTMYRMPLPFGFNRSGYFIIMAEDLPVKIPYGSHVYISITDENNVERFLARVPLEYRTVPA